MSLLECYNKVSVEEFKKMNSGAQENLCLNQKNKIKEILASNEMNMTQLVKDRIEILQRLG